MLPEAWCVGTLAVAVLILTLLQEFLCEYTHLREAIHFFLNFDVDISIGGGIVSEVVHGDKLFGEVRDFHAHVLWTCHWCHEVEIFEVNGAVACTLGRDDTVEVEFDRDHVNSGRTTVCGKVDSVTANGEARAVGVILFGMMVYTDALIRDFLEPDKWALIACNEHDSIGVFADTRNTLGQAAEFSGIRFSPKFLVLRVNQKVLHL
jgi:hypothetical protein